MIDDAGETAPTRVLEGIRVIEVSHFAYVPSAGAVLADWGADVVKVEHPEHGDPMRGGTIGGIPPGTGGLTFMWEVSNRGKRSVGIDLQNPDGLEVLLSLVEEADVFLTSFLPQVREKLGIDEESIRARNDSIIYAAGTGQGARGPEARAGGFDQISYWYRSGVASALVAEGDRPPDLPGPGFGDVTSGLVLAGGIAAALFHRQRTGRGTTVDGSLLATGMWALQPSLAVTGLTGAAEFRFEERTKATNPLVNTYRTSDGRFIGLCVLQSDKYWAGFCEAIGRSDLIDHPHFRTADDRAQHSAECVAVLDEVFARHPLDHWIEVLGTQEGQWAVVQRANELGQDPQVRANGYLQHVDYGDGRGIDLVPAPIQYDGEPARLRPAPDVGADTDEVLLERGLDWDRLIALKTSGAIS